jgi:desulfoferrodoxin (superoxide reductase-like protein)
LPIESFFKLLFLSIHVYVEFVTGWYKENPTDAYAKLDLDNAHHVCMLSGFIMQAVVEVLVYYGVPFPKKVEFFFAWIGFLIQALIMRVHQDGHPGLEAEVGEINKY